jgi:hypothetical protein
MDGFVGIALGRERFTSTGEQSNEEAEWLVESGIQPIFFFSWRALS